MTLSFSSLRIPLPTQLNFNLLSTSPVIPAPSQTIFIAGLVILGALITTSLNNRRRQDVRHLPGPSGKIASWIWGHERLVFEGQATEWYTKWTREFGSMFKIKGAFFHPDIVIATDHAAVQHIFANTSTYVKSPAFRPPIANLIGKGVVWAEGDEHAFQRRLCTPAFTPESVKGMAHDISECAEKLESRLTNVVLSNGGSTTLNIVEYISMCTLDIIGRVGFGHDFKAGQSTDAKEIASAWHSVIQTGLQFGAFVAILVLRSFPSITSLPIKALHERGACKVIVERIVSRMLEKGVVNEKGRDILSILQRASMKEDGKTLSKEQLIDNLNTFVMVGHETTAGFLDFLLYDLARHPEAQQKLRDEILKAGRDLSYDDVQKLEYLDAVVKEGLRLWPSSPQTERVAMKDDVIPLSKPIQTPNGKILTSLRVKKGQVFHIPFMTMQKDSSVWGNDSFEFKPERWIEPGGLPSTSELPRGWSNLVTFCDGPRNCLGYRLAVFESKVILATLVRTIEFQETTADVQYKISSTLQAVTDGQAGLLPLHLTLASA